MSKHHYIPQFYLKRWLNPNGYIHCYNYISDELVSFQKKSVTDIGQVKNLYKDLEVNHYATLDGKAANVIKIIDEVIREKDNTLILLDDILSYELREDFCRFISSLTGRQTKDINLAQKHVAKHVGELRNKYDWVPGANTIIESFDKTAANLIIAARSGYASGLFKKVPDNALPMLLHLKWYAIKFKNLKFDLLTTEKPVCFYRSFKGPKIQCNHLNDLLRNGYVLSFPLSPAVCFYASLVIGQPINLGNIIKFQNKLLFSNAPLEVYSTSPLHEPLIKKFLIQSKNVNLKIGDMD